MAKQRMTHRQLAEYALKRASRPLTVAELDAAICTQLGTRPTDDSIKRTRNTVGFLRQSNVIEAVGDQPNRAYRMLAPKTMGKIALPRTAPAWKPLELKRPYRREPYCAPNVSVTPPATRYIHI